MASPWSCTCPRGSRRLAASDPGLRGPSPLSPYSQRPTAPDSRNAPTRPQCTNPPALLTAAPLGPALPRQILRWLLAPVLLLIGKRRSRRALAAFEHRTLEDESDADSDSDQSRHRSRRLALVQQLAAAQEADRAESGLNVGRGNDLAAKMYNEFVAEQADNVVHMFGDFLLSILKE